MTTERVAIVLLHGALGAWCFLAAFRRPFAGRIAATVVASLLAASAMAAAVMLFIEAEKPENAGSFGPGLAGSIIFIGAVGTAAVAVLGQVGGEAGRWVAASALGFGGSFVVRATVAEPMQDDAATGSVVRLLVGLGLVAGAALLVGGSDDVLAWWKRRRPGFPLRP